MLNLNHKAKRELLTGMDYVRDNRLVAQRQYNYNVLGGPMTCDTRYPNKATHHADTFAYNKRGESPRGLGVGLDNAQALPAGRTSNGARSSQLTGATLGEAPYAYSYDNIGNRITAQEDAQSVTYEANNLNQYTQIDTDGTAFVPEYDADGNQTRIQTVTGIWKVQYNGQNRAIRYEDEADSTHIITCVYDSQGRRVEKKQEKEGAVISHVRYVYRGYLQVAAYDLLAEGLPSLWQIIWDPTQEIATRPLAIRADGAYSTYGWDLTKNICETYAGATGFLGHRYAYSPYGLVSLEGDTSYQPIQWSSEVYDEELGLNYYNYRYYNPRDGRWTWRDPLNEGGGVNLYNFVENLCTNRVDVHGMSCELSSEYCKGIWILINDAYLKSKIKPKDIVKGVGKTVAETLAKYALREYVIGTATGRLSAAVRGTQALLVYAYAFYVCSCKKEPYNKQGYIIGGEGPLPPTTTEKELQMKFNGEIKESNQYYSKLCNKCQTKSDETD